MKAINILMTTIDNDPLFRHDADQLILFRAGSEIVGRMESTEFLRLFRQTEAKSFSRFGGKVPPESRAPFYQKSSEFSSSYYRQGCPKNGHQWLRIWLHISIFLPVRSFRETLESANYSPPGPISSLARSVSHFVDTSTGSWLIRIRRYHYHRILFY